MELNREFASRIARIALGHVGREYPNSPHHVMTGDDDALTPRQLHPAFFGSFDWHSCVHSWWTLLTLRRNFASSDDAVEIAALADTTLTADKMAAELAYFQRPAAGGFERPYGWGWLLYLHLEASEHEDREWALHIEPLARHIAQNLRDYLAKLTYPITVGTHFNTAFPLILADEWAAKFDPELSGIIADWARRQFGNRENYRGWEPGGDEFLSPVLTAASLMTRALPDGAWAEWFEGLVVANGWLQNECLPVTVSDRSDGKIAHLDGLNLSRAWCLWEMAGSAALRPDLDQIVTDRAQQHFDAAIAHLSATYEGEHWLASFALLAVRAKANQMR